MIYKAIDLPENWYWDESRVKREKYEMSQKMDTDQKEYFYFKSRLNSQENEFFQRLKEKLDFNNVQISKTFSVVAPFLAKTLSDERKIILAQLYENNDSEKYASAFALNQKRVAFDENYGRRLAVLNHLEGKIRQWDWNHTTYTQVPVIPAVHATELSSAWKIVSSGFAILGAFDKGFYGKGVYLSTSAQYVRQYLSFKKQPCILVCFVVLGKCYPVVETHTGLSSLEAKPIKLGYNSHYVVTTLDGKISDTNASEVYDEIILGQELTAVPLFLLMINKSKSNSNSNNGVDEEENTHEPLLLM